VALPQIGSIIETRRARIEGDLAEAERLRKETEKAAAAYEAALAEARKNAQAIAEETRTSIKADIDNRRADVEAGLTKRISEAEARIAATKTAALANVDEIAADTAQAVVARVTGDATVEEARDAVAIVNRG
jgi:F-type H+-transporting ATPase subunit b